MLRGQCMELNEFSEKRKRTIKEQLQKVEKEEQINPKENTKMGIIKMTTEIDGAENIQHKNSES